MPCPHADIKPIIYATDLPRPRKAAPKSTKPRANKQPKRSTAATTSRMRNLSPPRDLPETMISPHLQLKKEFIHQEDMQLLLDAAQQQELQQHEEHEHEQLHYEEVTVLPPPTDRYPVIDPDRPFVCQKCGVSFAREKALLSHSKVMEKKH